MKVQLFINSGTTGLATAVRLAILNDKSGSDTLLVNGITVHRGADGPYVEIDRYVHRYPAMVEEAAVWRVVLTSTFGSEPPIQPGLFADVDPWGNTIAKACLCVRHTDAGQGYYELTVEGATLHRVNYLHMLLLDPARAVHMPAKVADLRICTWDVTA